MTKKAKLKTKTMQFIQVNTPSHNPVVDNTKMQTPKIITTLTRRKPLMARWTSRHFSCIHPKIIIKSSFYNNRAVTTTKISSECSSQSTGPTKAVHRLLSLTSTTMIRVKIMTLEAFWWSLCWLDRPKIAKRMKMSKGNLLQCKVPLRP